MIGRDEMSGILDAVRSLCESAEKHGVEAIFGPASLGSIREVQEWLPLSPELIEWYRIAAPQRVRIEWWPEDLGLYSLPDKILKFQEAFRWWPWGVGPQPTVQEGWNPNWVIIGDASDDPFFVHVDRPGSPVSYIWHDMDWIPTPITPDLTSFIHFLRVWIDVFYGQFGKQITDNDCVVLPAFREALRINLREILPESYINNIIRELVQ